MQIQGGFGMQAVQPMPRMAAGLQPAQISRSEGISGQQTQLSGEARQLAARAGQMKGSGTAAGPFMMGPEQFSKMVDQSSPSDMQSKTSNTKEFMYEMLGEAFDLALEIFG